MTDILIQTALTFIDRRGAATEEEIMDHLNSVDRGGVILLLEHMILKRHVVLHQGLFRRCHQIECICYGCGSSFEHEKFQAVRNREMFNKPERGLWSSPVDSEWSWKQWGEQNDFGDFSTCFSFVFSGSLLKIDSERSLELVYKNYPLGVGECFPASLTEEMKLIDWEKIADDYDGVWLTEKGENETRWSAPITLYGWDCETILVMNKDAVDA